MVPVLRPRPIKKSKGSGNIAQGLTAGRPRVARPTGTKGRGSVGRKAARVLLNKDGDDEQQDGASASGSDHGGDNLKEPTILSQEPEDLEKLSSLHDSNGDSAGNSCRSTHSYIIIEDSDSDPRSIIEKCIEALEKHNIAFCRKYCHCSLTPLVKSELVLLDAKLYLLELKNKISPAIPTMSEEIDYDFVETFLLELVDVDSWYSKLYLQSAERIETLHTQIFALEVEMLPFSDRKVYPLENQETAS